MSYKQLISNNENYDIFEIKKDNKIIGYDIFKVTILKNNMAFLEKIKEIRNNSHIEKNIFEY